MTAQFNRWSVRFGAIASIATLLAIPALADTVTTTTTPAASPMSTTITTTTTSPTPIADQAIDYSVLVNPNFSYFDIKRARVYGLRDHQIGRAIGIADKAGVRACDVIDMLCNGDTFSAISQHYGVSLDRVDDQYYTDKLHMYLAAYWHTGEHAMANGSMTEPTMGEITTSSTTTTTSGWVSNGRDNIVRTLREAGQFGTLIKVLHFTGLEKTLRTGGPYTLFAPTDAAFAKLPSGTLDTLMDNKDQLTKIIEYHVIPANISAADALAMTSPTSPATVEGQTLQVVTTNGSVAVNGANVVVADIRASNGVIHGIDTVLMPSDVTIPGWAPATSGMMNPMPAASGAVNVAPVMNGATVPAPVTNGTVTPAPAPM